MNQISKQTALLLTAIVVTVPLQFPTLVPKWMVLAAVIIAIIATLSYIISNQFRIETPVDVPLLLIVLLIPLNVWISGNSEATLVRAYSLFGTLFIFWAIVAQRRRQDLLMLGQWLLLLGGLLLALLIFLWTPFSAPSAQFLQETLLSPFPQLRNTIWGTQLNTNLSAGVILLFWPPAFAIALFDKDIRKRLLALPLLIAIPLILMFGQSRGALIGLIGALVTIMLIRFRNRPLPLISVGLVVSAVAVMSGVWGRISGYLENSVNSSSALSLEGRLELWRHGIYLVQDFPLTGVGLNQVEPVVDSVYPLFLIAGDAPFSHVHNIFLQTAAESGLVSLVLYVALYLILGGIVIKQSLNHHRQSSAILVGLLGSLVAFFLHNSIDSITFFPRASFIVWSVFGYALAVALAKDGQFKPAVSANA